ncbi:hypothetical protein DDT46_13860 [Mycobacteroides abscessus]|uniref:hypothetical protein n=1 Tax=Mycobacteroides abscessus TaxID=36809 RepID=UPI000C25727A|nr:hypothetical protein [Mycobacteroides abscessus]AWG64771.1 hypothetical protein DDT46_13860 [Mycobacteroides abscessus]RIS83609.1 hypothetical protein D2E44_10680 [Mycobacteroides abscessus]
MNSAEVIHEPGVDAKWVLDMSSFADSDSATAAVETSRSVLQTMPQVEQAINVCLDEHGTAVARVVHTFGGRDVYLRDGSRIAYRWELFVCDWRCLGCGLDMSTVDEYYMLKNDVWAQVDPAIDGNLCIACVEERLGRTLTAADFTDSPINTSTAKRRTQRLADRLSSGINQNLPIS